MTTPSAEPGHRVGGTPRGPLDPLLDLVLYAPVGFATSSRELLPELVAKGRQQVDAQVRLARMLGQFAVAYGRVEARKRLPGVFGGGEAAPPSRPTPAPAGRAPAPRPVARPAAARRAAAPPAAPGNAEAAGPPPRRRPSAADAPPPRPGRVDEVVPVRQPARTTAAPEPTTAPARTAAPARTTAPARATAPAARPAAPTSAELAIPGYDALAASQVVARLDGLTTAELEQVRRYEQANRNRRTILGKITQLEGSRR